MQRGRFNFNCIFAGLSYFTLFSFFILSELSAATLENRSAQETEIETCVADNNKGTSDREKIISAEGDSCDPALIPTPYPTPEEPEQECPDCPPVLVITINGVNANFDSPFHDIDNWLDIPFSNGEQIPIDPFHGIFQACGAHPLKPSMLENIREWIDEWKAANPCGKVVIIGHSMGGITAWGLRNDGDCVFALDPPLNACNRCSSFWCQSMKDTCKSIDEGIENWPGYINWEDHGLPHTPFGDPDKHCDQLSEVQDKIRQCLADVAPNCEMWQPGAGGYVCGTIFKKMSAENKNEKNSNSSQPFYEELDATINYLNLEMTQQPGFSAVVYPSSCSR